MKYFLGIDPGAAGGLTLMDETGKIRWICLLVPDPAGGIDFDQLRANLQEVRGLTEDGQLTVYLERAVSFGMGGKSAFNYGKGFAAIEIALKVASLAYTLLEPKKWTKEIYQGIDQKLKPKEQGRIALARLFPDYGIVRGPKSGKPHEGLMDSLFIAEYGRRRGLLSS